MNLSKNYLHSEMHIDTFISIQLSTKIGLFSMELDEKPNKIDTKSMVSLTT